MANKQFSVVDYLRGAMPTSANKQQEEPGLGLWEAGKAFVEGAPIVFDSLVNAASDAIFGFDPHDTEREAERAADARKAEAYRRKYEGKGSVAEAVAGAAESSGMSLAGLPAAAAAGIMAAPSGPLAFGAAGAAGGSVAARVDYVDNQRRLYNEAVRRNGGKPLTDEQWASVQAEFGSELAEHAVTEGAGEAVGDALTFGLFQPLGAVGGKVIGNLGEGVAKKAIRGAGKVGVDVGGELLTETGQSYIQGGIESQMYGTDRPTLKETFSEVAGPTIVQSLLFAGGAKASNIAANKLRGTTPATSADNPFPQTDQVGDDYQFQNPFGDIEEPTYAVGPRPDVVEGELVDDIPDGPSGGAGGWEQTGTGLGFTARPAIGRVPGSIQSEATREFGRYGWREGDNRVSVIGFSGNDVLVDIEGADGTHTQEYRSREAIARPRSYSTPMPPQSPEIDLMNPAPAAPMAAPVPVQQARTGMIQQPSGFGLSAVMPQVASAAPAAMPVQNAPALPMTAPAPVQEMPAIPQAGFGLVAAQPAQKVQALLEGSPVEAPQNLENVTKAPAKSLENVTAPVAAPQQAEVSKMETSEVVPSGADRASVLKVQAAELDEEKREKNRQKLGDAAGVVEEYVSSLKPKQGDFVRKNLAKHGLYAGTDGAKRNMSRAEYIVEQVQNGFNVVRETDYGLKLVDPDSGLGFGINKSEADFVAFLNGKQWDKEHAAAAEQEAADVDAMFYHYKGKRFSRKQVPVSDARREEMFDRALDVYREKAIANNDTERVDRADVLDEERARLGLATDEAVQEIEEYLYSDRAKARQEEASGKLPASENSVENKAVAAEKPVEAPAVASKPDKKKPEKWASEEDLDHLFGTEFGTADKPNIPAIAEHFKTQLLSGKGYRTIGEARQEVAAKMRLKQKDLVKIAKTIDEAIELGVVRAARSIVRSGKSELEIYRELVDLYKRQPNLGVRTSTSIAEQAYSTPVPLAYLADVLAGVNESTRVYEPTAGNGALLLTASPENAVVNELNHDRAERLRSQGFTVTEEDASSRQLDEDVDAVVANPPFGTVMMEDGSKKKFRFRNLETVEIDQAISLNALDELAKGGRAVLIIGGKKGDEKARSTKYNTANQRAFWNTMFENFNVVDHFTVSGDLYSRQGAKYPIDFVVIDGHTPTKNPVFPAARVPRVYDTFEALEEKLNEAVQRESERTERDRVSEGEGDTQPSRVDGRDGRVGREVSDAGRAGDEVRADAGVDRRPVEQERRAGSQRDSGNDAGRDERNIRNAGRAGSDGDTAGTSQPVGQRGGLAAEDGAGGRRSGVELSEPDRGAGAVRSGLDVEPTVQPATSKAKKAAPKPKSTSTQAAYKTSSEGFQLGTLVPKNMDAPVQEALRRATARHNDVDAYVTRELGYSSVEEMHNAFAAEQVDALALALDNMGRGKGFILGDQTGIGKGRVCAGILRWAKKNGRTPIFVTMLPDLYADMMRDLNDIGVTDFRPFITNSDISGTKALIAPDGSALAAPKKKDYDAAVEYIRTNNALPEGYDAVFTSYSQLQSVKGVPSKRQVILDSLQDSAVLVLDEAHNAGGSTSSIGLYIRDYTEKMSGGVLYSSATYAKRPDVMSLYNKTDVTMIGSQQELEDTTSAGGLPMQQAISAMLTGGGQYIRREKSYEGATMSTTEAAVDMVTADEIAKCMESVMAFSIAMEGATAKQDDLAKAKGRAVTGTKSTGGAGAQSTSFGSLMHNLVAQTTLAIKADSVVKAAAEAVKRGEKPIITLANTMGSFIADYASTHDLKAGDAVNLTFADMFKSYLEKTREVRITDATRKVEKKRLTDEELGYTGVQAYKSALKTIEDADFSRLPVSPIDYILDGLRRAGVRASEITGRTAALDYSGDTPVYRVRKASVAEKQAASRGFNGGDIDCLIINRSGSTGISLHASEKFVDQKRRTMMIVQPDLNIDVFMQTLGRVFRTGQVVPPKYEFVLSNMPSERRPAAVLGKKMASLNANTTASAKGTQSFDNIPDFLNTYGDQAALELLQEDTALNARLGYPLKKSKDEEGKDDVKTEGLVAKLTGRIPLLSVADQSDVYDRLLKVYQSLVDMADATGTNVLDVKARPLDAKIVSRAPLTPKLKGDSPFAAASDLCVCDVKVVGKPYSSDEVKKHVEEGKAATEKVFDGLAERAGEYMRKSVARYKDEEAQQRERDKIDEQLLRVSRPIERFPVGTRVRMTSTTGSYVGVVTNYLTDAGKKEGSNPVAPSAWRVVVDIADAKRRLVVPFSKLVLGDGNIDGGRILMNYTYDGVSAESFWKRFDDAQSESRETRLIVMGNIPAGYAKLGQAGEIITFDMHDGQRVMGVILPKDARGEEVMEDMPVRFTKDAQIVEFFDRTGGRVQVVSSDDLVSIDGMQGGQRYHIRVPGSKAEGGKFFLSKLLIDTIGEDFVKKSGDMHAEFRGNDRLRSVLTLLGMMGVRFQTKVSKDIAREITGTSVTFVKEGDGGSYASLRPSFASNRSYAALRLSAEIREGMKKVVASVQHDVIRAEGGKRIIEAVQDWARKNWTKAFKAPGVGEVLVNDASVKSTFSSPHGLYKNKVTAFPAIKDVVEKGAYLGSFPDIDGKKIDNHYWCGTVNFVEDGKVVPRLLFVRAREVENHPKRFYVHNVYTEEQINSVAPLSEAETLFLEGAGSRKQDSPDTPTFKRGATLEARILRTILEVNGQSRATVENIVRKLSDAAAGAAPVNVVQSFDELPEHLQEQFRDQAGDLEGLYDEGTVWIVAGNLPSEARAAEVWMHEQVGHGGFEALMPEKEKLQLLNRLFAMLGGKGNVALRSIAEEYKFDLGSRKGQQDTVREYLARLAEKESLSEKEGSLWKRAWKHIADTLKKLFYRLTSQNAKLGEMEVRDLLKAMKRRVREGGPDGPKGGTYASFISDAAKKAFDKTASAMGKPENFTADAREAYSNLSKQAKQDIGLWNKFISQPYAIAKKFPLLRTLMDIQSLREDKRREAYIRSMKGVDAFQKMKKDDPTAYKYARDLIIALDAEYGEKLKKNLKAEMFLFDEDGKRTGFNPEYYSEMRDLIMGARNRETHKDEAAFARAVDAYMDVRRSLDRDLAAILQRSEELGFQSEEEWKAEFNKRKVELEANKNLTKEQREAELDAMRDARDRWLEKLDTMRKNMGRRPFYFPRMRFGSYYALFKDAGGKTIYRVHYDAATQAQAALEAAKIKATMLEELAKMGIQPDDVEFENGKLTGIPQEVFADTLSTTNTEAIIREAINRMEQRSSGLTAHEALKMRLDLLDQISEVMKSSGFGQHMMRRADSKIAGYETEDVFKSLSAYKAGLHGWLTKMEASYQFATELSDFAAKEGVKKSPELYKYAQSYVRDMLRNSDKIDRMNSRIRAGLFLWFLGGNLKSALVNATQNFTLGIPVLGAEIGYGKSWGKVLSGSRNAVEDWVSKREAGQESKYLTKEEATFLDDFQKHGEALARKTLELTGMQDKGWSSSWANKIAEWAGKPIEYAEKFNRMSLALAAYRAAKAGDVSNEKTLAEYGETKGEAWSETNARKFAREIVNEAHFVYGKANQPAPVRGWARGAGFGYTFRTYAQSLASWYYRMLSGEKGSAGRIAATQAVLHNVMLGGVAAIPFYGTLRTVLTEMFGGEPPEEVLGYDQIDILMYGLPSLAGAYVGGSMELDVPVVKDLRGNESWVEQLQDSLWLAVTGPLGGAVDKVGRATYYASTGQKLRMVEELSPTAIANILKTHRLSTEGARTKSGRPIPADGDTSGKPAKLSGAEVALQAVGFQPLSRAQGWNTYQVKQEKKAYKSEYQSDLVTRYVMAKSQKERTQLENERIRWNKEHPDQQIKPLWKLAKNRERPVK